MNRLQVQLMEQLVDAGTWVSRTEFEVRQQCSGLALDDALADLVIAGQADFRTNVGYRLAGTPLCRQAAQLKHRRQQAAAVVGKAETDGYHVGVAETRAQLGLVLYELTLPLPGPDEDALAHQLQQVGGVVEFTKTRGGRMPEQEYEVDALRKRVLQALEAGAGRRMGAGEVAAAVGMPTWAVMPALERAREAGEAWHERGEWGLAFKEQRTAAGGMNADQGAIDFVARRVA